MERDRRGPRGACLAKARLGLGEVRGGGAGEGDRVAEEVLCVDGDGSRRSRDRPIGVGRAPSLLSVWCHSVSSGVDGARCSWPTGSDREHVEVVGHTVMPADAWPAEALRVAYEMPLLSCALARATEMAA